MTTQLDALGKLCAFVLGLVIVILLLSGLAAVFTALCRLTVR